MKKFLLFTAVIIGVLLLALVIFAEANYTRTFDAPYPDITASTDSAVIARGKYLVYGPAHCAHCHSPVDQLEAIEAGQIVSLSGGSDFQLPIGTVYAPNITPDKKTGIGTYTDGEIARALRYGVRKDGRAMLDFMPFYDLSNEDLTAVISFLRSQNEVENNRPEHHFNLLGKIMLALSIKPAGDGIVPEAPGRDTTAEYGEYLVSSVANCRGCHTERNLMDGSFTGPILSGGFRMEALEKDGRVSKTDFFYSPNLTNDPETGKIYSWNQAYFIQRFRTGRLQEGSPMPWGPFSRLEESDLKAIYAYLKTVDGVQHALPSGIQHE